MDSKELATYRKKIGLTQKELAQLLVTSIKTVHSYEQGWRNIPENIERQVLFLISRQSPSSGKGKPCWIQKKCPKERKKKCPAWKFKTGELCWFITGTLCEGKIYRNWKEKIEHCRSCVVFKPISDL
jgi:hypothetical protein